MNRARSPHGERAGQGGSDRPPAVVVGLDCITGLQTARILQARGVEVIGIASDSDHFCCRTRVARVVQAPTSGDGLIAALERLRSELGRPGVLVPCTDAAVRTLAEHRDALEAWWLLGVPDLATIDELASKDGFADFCSRHGIDQPTGVTVTSEQDAAEAEKLTFPVVVKPSFKSPEWEAEASGKVVLVDSVEQWRDLYRRVRDLTPAIVVQEWIEGGEDTLYSCNWYASRDGEVLATFTARKLRQWPPDRGTSALGEEVRADVVAQMAQKLLANARLPGLGYIEVKHDLSNDRWVAIEPNLGRPTGRSAIAEAGGVELLATMYADLAGLPLPTERTQTFRGARWIYLRHDLQSALYRIRRGELTVAGWLRTLRGPTFYAVWSWKDPMPFLLDWWGAAGKALQSVGAKLGRKVRP